MYSNVLQYNIYNLLGVYLVSIAQSYPFGTNPLLVRTLNRLIEMIMTKLLDKAGATFQSDSLILRLYIRQFVCLSVCSCFDLCVF